MTGEMKLAETLCVKGFPPSDGRDEGIFEVRGKRDSELAHLSTEKGAQEESLALHSQRGSVRLSGWEQNIPTLGTPLLILLNGSSEGHYCSNELFSIILLEESKTCPYDSRTSFTLQTPCKRFRRPSV